MARRNDGTLLELAGQIYDAALAPERWPTFLANVADTLGAPSAILYFRDLDRLQAYSIYASGLPPEFLDRHDEHYLAIDPWGAYLAQQPVGRVFLTQDIVPDRTFERSEFYNEYIRPISRFYATGGFFVRDGQLAGQLGVQRQRRQGAFLSHDNPLLEQLFPHLRRAFSLSRQFDDLRDQADDLQAALDHSPIGVMMLDGALRLVYSNRTAEALLRGAYGIIGTGRRLVARDPADNDRLQRLTREALLATQRRNTRPPGSIFIVRGHAARPLCIEALPLGDSFLRTHPLTDRARVLLRVRQLGQPATFSDALLRDLFGLTPAETRLARLLAQGRSLVEAAAYLGISKNTVRSQLRALFDKTGVNRQAELVRLLVALGNQAFDSDQAGRPD